VLTELIELNLLVYHRYKDILFYFLIAKNDIDESTLTML